MQYSSVLSRWLCLSSFILALGAAPTRAEPVPPAEPAKAEAEPAPPPLPWQFGPTPLELGHGVKVDLPEGYQFLGQPKAGELMAKMGNLYNDNLLGIVVPSAEDKDYFVTVRYDEEGYIKDDEKLDGAEILASLREGEDAYNAERKKAGFPEIHADGWQEAPHYDRAHHHVVWGLIVRDSDGSSINYNTRVLGRKGYVSVNLVTDPEKLAADKPAAATLLAATSFANGARYEDFDATNDKVAEYGLTGLVLGGAGFGLAKLAKVGLLAKFGKVILAALIAGKKLIMVLLVGAGAAIRKFLSRRSTQPEA